MEKESLLKFISGFIIIPARNYEIRVYGSMVIGSIVQWFIGSKEKGNVGMMNDGL